MHESLSGYIRLHKFVYVSGFVAKPSHKESPRRKYQGQPCVLPENAGRLLPLSVWSVTGWTEERLVWNGWKSNPYEEHIKAFQPQWYISTIYHCRDTPFWLETLDMGPVNDACSSAQSEGTILSIIEINNAWRLGSRNFNVDLQTFVCISFSFFNFVWF